MAVYHNPPVDLRVYPCVRRLIMVGLAGFEPTTP
jgi:hypothetical protein